MQSQQFRESQTYRLVVSPLLEASFNGEKSVVLGGFSSWVAFQIVTILIHSNWLKRSLETTSFQ